MDSSSDDEGVLVRRKSSSRKIVDSDEETDGIDNDNLAEATEDFKLRLSDEEDDDGAAITARIEADLAEESEDNDTGGPSIDEGGPSKSKDYEKSKILSSPEEDAEKSNVARKSVTTSCARGPADIMKKLTALADSDSESDVDGELESVKEKSIKKSKKPSKTVSDSDSETESNKYLSDEGMKETISTSTSKKRKSGPERKSKTKAKDAMLEIKAESQRQLRQSNIGLPYHIPKQRSLLDFLNRRKSSSPMPIKGSAEQLAAVWKQIEEREKEAEEFYKSESEQESDADDEGCTQESDDDTSNLKEADQPPKDCESSPLNSHEGASSVERCQADEKNIDGKEVDPTRPEDSAIISQTVSEGSAVDESCKAYNNMDKEVDPKPSDDQFIGSQNSPESVAVSGPEEAKVSQESAEFETEGTQQTETIVEVNKDDRSSEADRMTTKESMQTISEVADLHDAEKRKKETNLGFVKQPSFVGTQDSQDISLHFSETEKLVGSNSNVSEDVNTNEKSVEDTSEEAAKNWEDLYAKMKSIEDEDSESEDRPAKESIPVKPSLTSGSRLSLKGAPNEVIDLDDLNSDQSRTPGVKGLIERFMKHSASKKPLKPHTVELSLISSEKNSTGGVVEVKHESLKIVIAADEKPNPSDNPIPGASLKLLKSQLNHQMRKQKEEEWQKKQEEMKKEQTFNGEKDDCGMLPDEEEEEEEMTDSEAESEPEINDVREPKKKNRSKSRFVDEEAEVEDDDDGNGDERDEEEEDDDEEEDEETGNDDVNDLGSDEDMGDEGESCKEIDDVQHKGTSDKDSQKRNGDVNVTQTPCSLRRTTTSVSDLFASQSSEWRDDDDDDPIPAGQPHGVVRRNDTFNQSHDEKTMLFSPISLSIPGKTKSFMDADYELTPTKLSWPTESNSQNSIQKLFTEPAPSSTQEKLDEIAGLFGAKFNDSQEGLLGLANTPGNVDTESDLMALCSGKFVTQAPQPEDLEGDNAQASGSSGSKFLTQTQDGESSQATTVAADDSADFSLKLDEDVKNTEDVDESSKENTDTVRFEIMSSDEEENTISDVKKKKKRNRKLEFSDDEDESVGQQDAEDSDAEESEEDEEPSEKPQSENVKLYGVFSKQQKEVYYDSDENEIEPVDFLDKEAELSEEEDWQGSEDEDEKGLDQIEMEEADKEDIDQDLVREQLVKNQMKDMLDEDRRDVRILQEMLLEDGELHSDTGGRERQFRWKNVDSTGMGDDGHRSDEDHAEQEDEEDDAEWRKKRHERETFLKEQREKEKKEAGDLENDDDLENSELLQLGKSVLFKSRSASLEMTAKEPPAPKLTVQNQLLSPDGKRPNSLLSKRGSFLSRGDGVLAKLAKMTGPAKENVLAGAKNRGNFVFSAISPTKKGGQPEEDIDLKSGKRKASVSLMNPAEKKPCLPGPARKGSGLFDHL